MKERDAMTVEGNRGFLRQQNLPDVCDVETQIHT